MVCTFRNIAGGALCAFALTGSARAFAQQDPPAHESVETRRDSDVEPDFPDARDGESSDAQSESRRAPANVDAAVLLDVLAGLKGESLTTRVRALEQHVRDYPDSDHAAYLWEQAQQLRRLIELKTDELAPEAVRVVSFEPPVEANADEPLALAFQVSGEVLSVTLNIRAEGDSVYEERSLESRGAGFWGYTLRAGEVTSPSVEYFVEAERADGVNVVLIASGESPGKIAVRPAATASPMADAGVEVALWTDYADYNRLRGNDWAWQTEGYFGLRLSDVGFRALRSGFGVYRGVGGSVEELDEQGTEGRDVGLSYGWIEAEVAFVDMFSLIGRALVGLRDDGVAGGGQAFVRIGNDRRTNLLLGGEIIGGIGLRGIVQLELDAIERVPIMIRSEITNQPAGDTSEVGGRAIFQVGYQLVPGFVLSARASYQGRTIEHSGPGFGGAVRYAW